MSLSIYISMEIKNKQAYAEFIIGYTKIKENETADFQLKKRIVGIRKKFIEKLRLL